MGEQNWAGNYTYRATRIHYPESVDAVRSVVARSRKLKALGTRHSFNSIADTDGEQICLDRMKPVFTVDRDRRHVTIDAGARYGRVARELYAAGFALPNLASLPHISVAGACATATHGSGDRNGCLATSVRALEMVTADGEAQRFTRADNPDIFDGLPVSLGALGVVTSLTLDIVPAFEIRQDVYVNVPFQSLVPNFDKVMSSGYSVSLFTDWRHDHVGQVWLKSAAEAAPPPLSLLGAERSVTAVHPIFELSAENCTEQGGRSGPWHERLPHFRMEFTPSCGEELQSEYLVPRSVAREALTAIRRIGSRIAPALLVSEVRSVAADALWLSPFYEQDSIALHFTWRKDWHAVQAVLADIEAALEPFGARPHWGKLYTIDPTTLGSRYPRWEDFCRLRRTLDPNGKFVNSCLERLLGRQAVSASETAR